MLTSAALKSVELERYKVYFIIVDVACGRDGKEEESLVFLLALPSK